MIPDSVTSLVGFTFADCHIKYMKVEGKGGVEIGSPVIWNTHIRNASSGAALYVYKEFKGSYGFNNLNTPESVICITP